MGLPSPEQESFLTPASCSQSARSPGLYYVRTVWQLLLAGRICGYETRRVSELTLVRRRLLTRRNLFLLSSTVGKDKTAVWDKFQVPFGFLLFGVSRHKNDCKNGVCLKKKVAISEENQSLFQNHSIVLKQLSLQTVVTY